MSNTYILLAQVDDPAEALRNAAGQRSGPLIDANILVLLAAIAGIGILLFLFVYLLRRRTVNGDEVLYRHRDFSGESSSRPGRRRWRDSDAARRPRRNPTLAETGGLPPPRPDEPDTPPSSSPASPSQNP